MRAPKTCSDSGRAGYRNGRAVDLGGRRDIVLAGNRSIRQRIQRRDGERDRVRRFLGITPAANGAPVKRSMGRRRLRENHPCARPRSGRWRFGNPLADPPAFVIQKEEAAILAHRAAERPAELIADVLRRRFVRGRESSWFRPERNCAGTRMRSRAICWCRLEHDVHLRAGVPPERCVVGVGEHLKLPNRVHRRRDGKSVQLRIAIVDTIEQIIIGHPPSPVDVEGKSRDRNQPTLARTAQNPEPAAPVRRNCGHRAAGCGSRDS